MEGEFDKDEWFDVARKFKPELTREEFEAEWEEFQRQKAARMESLKVN